MQFSRDAASWSVGRRACEISIMYFTFFSTGDLRIGNDYVRIYRRDPEVLLYFNVPRKVKSFLGFTSQVTSVVCTTHGQNTLRGSALR